MDPCSEGPSVRTFEFLSALTVYFKYTVNITIAPTTLVYPHDRCFDKKQCRHQV